MIKKKPRGRFTQIENEREQKRKAYEENLRRKRDELYFEFEKQEEVLKFSRLSVESRNDVKFKHELDRVTTYFNTKTEQLNHLQKKLQDIIEEKEAKKELEGQGENGNRLTTNNFTSIFSKKYYKSIGVEMLGEQESKKREDVYQHIIYLEEEVEQKDINARNEVQKNSELKSQLSELIKTKQKLRSEVLDLEFLERTAEKRFLDLEAVQYNAKEKKTAIQQDLQNTKQSLKQYKEIGAKYQEKQLAKMREGEKIKKTAEEIITHDMIRIDELQKEQQIQQEKIQQQMIKEKKILKKRKKSKFTLEFIEIFKTLERLFCKNIINEKEIEELYNKNKLEQNPFSQNNIQEDNDDDEDYQLQATIHQDQSPTFGNTLNEQHVHSPFQRGSMASTNDSQKLINSQEDDNRFSLIQAINKFDSKHPDGAKDLVDKLIKLYNELAFREKELSTSFNLLLQSKQEMKNSLIDLDNELINLKEKNDYLKQMIENTEVEEELSKMPEAFDSGIVVLNVKKDKKDNKSNNNQQIESLKVSTVNILKMEDFTAENEKLKEQIQKNQNFVFNFFSNYSESAVRLCQMISLIHGASGGVSSEEIEAMAKQVVSFIKDIWEGKFEEADDSEQQLASQNKKQKKKKKKMNGYKISNKISSLTLIINLLFQLSGHEEIEDIIGGNEGYFKKIQTDKYTQEEIKDMFLQIFPGRLEDAHNFFYLIKSERIIWFFCNIQQIKEYLIDVSKQIQQNQKKHQVFETEQQFSAASIQKVFDNIDFLKKQGVLIFQSKLQALREMMTGMLKKIQLQTSSAMRLVADADPEFDPETKVRYQNLRDNDEIKEAKLKATQKNDNYFRNNEPLQEDLFVLYSDKQEGSMRQVGEKGQLREDKSSDRNINSLVDYIKKTKNMGQVLLKEQKKKNVQQLIKEKRQQSTRKQSPKESRIFGSQNQSPEPFEKKKQGFLNDQFISQFSSVSVTNPPQPLQPNLIGISNQIVQLPQEKNTPLLPPQNINVILVFEQKG